MTRRRSIQICTAAALSWMLALVLPMAAQAAPATRIVSLDLCTDWMLAHYGNRASVAALSPLHLQYPAAAFSTGWPTHDGSLERILALKPDLVITGEFNALQLRNRLKALGVRVEVLKLPSSLPAVIDYEKHMLSLLGLPADKVSMPPQDLRMPRERKRLLLLGANGVGTGRGTFEDEILERAGWTNYLRDEGYLRLDLEQVATDAPDAILWAAPNSKALANRFAEHPVLRRAVPREQWLTTDFWRWQCPGPWTWDLIRQLNQWHE